MGLAGEKWSVNNGCTGKDFLHLGLLEDPRGQGGKDVGLVTEATASGSAAHDTAAVTLLGGALRRLLLQGSCCWCGLYQMHCVVNFI
jgi:hypothetical protein